MAKLVAVCNDTPTQIIIPSVVINGVKRQISERADQPTDVPSGLELTLEWDFHGNPGEVGSVELWEAVGKKWAPFTPKMEVTMPGGKTNVTSANPPAGYVAYTFQT